MACYKRIVTSISVIPRSTNAPTALNAEMPQQALPGAEAAAAASPEGGAAASSEGCPWSRSPPPPRSHLQRLHSGLRSARSTGSAHSPSALAPSDSSSRTAACVAGPSSRRSSSLGVSHREVAGGRATGSLGVPASFCGSMTGAQVRLS